MCKKVVLSSLPVGEKSVGNGAEEAALLVNAQLQRQGLTWVTVREYERQGFQWWHISANSGANFSFSPLANLENA